MGRLIIDGNSVYEIDEECEKRRMKSQEWKKNGDGKQEKRKEPGMNRGRQNCS